ncbi:MAG: hypothetical protein ACP5UK_03630 [Conexivisphaera sp.]
MNGLTCDDEGAARGEGRPSRGLDRWLGGEPVGEEQQHPPGAADAEAAAQPPHGWSISFTFDLPGGEDLVLMFWSAPRVISLRGRAIVSVGVLGRRVIRGRAPRSVTMRCRINP